MDRFTALKTFCSVVHARSFVGAAQLTGLSRSAVSKNIRELENHLGVTLIRRTTRGISLTESGEAYYVRMQRLLNEMQEADDDARQSSTTPRGVLRVAAPMSLGLMCITPRIPIFMQHYPAITIDVVLSDDKSDLLAEGFDMAIRGSSGTLADSSIVARSIGEFRHVVCAAPDYLSTHPPLRVPEDLKDHACLVYSGAANASKWDFTRDGEACSVSVTPTLSCNNSLALRQTALHGLGVLRIPEIFVRGDLQAGQLNTVLDDWSCPRLDVWAMYFKAASIPQRLRLFIDFLIEEFASFREGDTSALGKIARSPVPPQSGPHR